MCLDVIGCHAVDTVIYDSRVGIRPIEPVRYFQSSHHLIPFSLIAHTPLPVSLLPACFKQSPAPGRGRSRREDDLRLRADRRFACFPSCRAALSLPLVRYSVEVRLRCVLLDYLVIGSVPSSCSCVPASFDVI